ncbi:hypothetical protein [Novosphingobium sp.]|uniref:hypothetical protein n=1 Tax=Novosphingobium sp. TaxID=1874826 RepID=UPI002610533A|nr:hypothetical protein [Novosphingobium sp.]
MATPLRNWDSSKLPNDYDEKSGPATDKRGLAAMDRLPYTHLIFTRISARAIVLKGMSRGAA